MAPCLSDSHWLEPQIRCLHGHHASVALRSQPSPGSCCLRKSRRCFKFRPLMRSSFVCDEGCLLLFLAQLALAPFLSPHFIVCVCVSVCVSVCRGHGQGGRHRGSVSGVKRLTQRAQTLQLELWHDQPRASPSVERPAKTGASSSHQRPLRLWWLQRLLCTCMIRFSYV